MKLHRYQENCLADLRAFFAQTEKLGSPQRAFLEMHNRTYYPPPNLSENIPYLCIRIPTGGGKTLLAAHAAGVAATEYLHSQTPAILWLAPGDTIVSQTLRNLQNRNHPCRRALTDAFTNVEFISAQQALSVSKADMDGAATVIVGTIQSLRIEKTAGRKVYGDNDALMPHFDSLPESARARLEKNEGGGIKYSLANVLSTRRPLVISDEAHNSGTKLSFESLARIAPSCILEFTATPQTQNNPRMESYASNVLSQASARELKEAGMIKFPLNFEVQANWRENIRAAVAKREELEKTAAKEAKKTGEYIRPIVLYQAENVGGAATAEIVRKTLKEDFKIPAAQIAVHTGTTRELQKQAADLFSRDCPLRHIITVQALAEGWDCSFAYILCTMANWNSPRAVEQILGRILRLPNAGKKQTAALNECYAFAARGNFYEVAAALKDTLVKKSGFQKMETKDFVQSSPSESGDLFDENSGESKKVARRRTEKPLRVPMLMAREKGELAFLEPAHFLGVKWSIVREKANISNFLPPKTVIGTGRVTVKESGTISVHGESAEELREQLMLLDSDKKWTETSLAAWLDAEIPHPDIPQMQSSPYILAAVNGLAKKHAIKKLARLRFYIRKWLKEEMDELRKKRAEKGLQQILKNITADGDKLEVSAAHAVEFEQGRYGARRYCENAAVFRKHLFPEQVGELKESGEEWECARCLDEMPEVEVWVRNLDRRENSFWLQTSDDKFYPDFVCRLKDGRILVVEYKSEDRWSNDDSKEKRALGEMWAKLSGGKCLFVMPKGMNWNAIRECVAVKN